jgi:N-acetylneuraminate synthase
MRTKEVSTLFVADIGSNHNQDLDRCLKLIRAAKKIGCWGVKIQLFKANKLHAPGYIPKELKEREFPERWIPILSAYCKEIDIKFGGTPFDLKAVDLLVPYVDFLKISSFDILRDDLIEKCVMNGYPNVIHLIISTGMASIEEIKESRKLIENAQRDARETRIIYPDKITYLHCISDYPTWMEKYNLGRINEMDYQMDIYRDDTDIGWSDHTADPLTIYEAHCRGAKMIEFHLDLDEKGAEYQYKHCYLPEMIEPMINRIKREIEQAKIFNDGEKLVSNDRGPIKKRDLRADPSDGLRPMKSARK